MVIIKKIDFVEISPKQLRKSKTSVNFKNLCLTNRKLNKVLANIPET